MAIKHTAFLLDCEGFRSRISPLVDALDNRDPTLLYDEALSIIDSSKDSWVFDSISYELINISENMFCIS